MGRRFMIVSYLHHWMFDSSAGISLAFIRQTDGMWHVMVGHTNGLPFTINYAAASVLIP